MNASAGCRLRAERILVCAVVLMMLGLPAVGQTVRVGVRAGPAFGFLSDSAIPFIRTEQDAFTNTNVRVGVQGGAYAVIPLTNRVGLQMEASYVRKGGHISHFSETSYRAEQYQLSYLQGQVLGRRDVSLPGPLRLHVVAGLTAEWLLRGVMRRHIHTREVVLQETVDLRAQELVRRWDIGGLIGIGMAYPIGEGRRLALELRYNLGFRTVFTQTERASGQKLGTFADPSPLSRVPPPLRHDVITASLSYTMPLWQ